MADFDAQQAQVHAQAHQNQFDQVLVQLVQYLYCLTNIFSTTSLGGYTDIQANAFLAKYFDVYVEYINIATRYNAWLPQD